MASTFNHFWYAPRIKALNVLNYVLTAKEAYEKKNKKALSIVGQPS